MWGNLYTIPNHGQALLYLHKDGTSTKEPRQNETGQGQEQKEDLLTVSDYLKLAQQVFNKWIRLRDQEQGCISCGTPLGSKYDAGHFWSAGGHSSVRFHPDNVHAQCVSCNQHKHGNLLPYREALIKKIGHDGYGWLETFAHETRKWDKEELKELIATYKKKIKDGVY